MPIHRCKAHGKYGWQWGDQKCYVGLGALAKAKAQAKAIHSSGYTENAKVPARTDKVVPSNPLKADPTRTLTLRTRLMGTFGRRFDRLKKKVIDLVEKEDAFGLTPRVHNTRWEFATTLEQLKQFQEWLTYQIGIEILGTVGEKVLNEYWREFIHKAYEQGAGRAFDDTKKPYARGYAVDESTRDFYKKGKYDFLKSAFGTPIAKERLEILAGRVFTELKGVTEPMATSMSRVLVDGLARGENPRTLARQLADQVDVGKKRSLTIARTEVVRAHNEGQLDGLEKLGVDKIGVGVEWSTSGRGTSRAGNPSPCSLCAPLQGVILTMKEARGMLPRHPNCMCSYIPANVGEDQKKQKRSAADVRQALTASIAAERGKRTKRTIAEQRVKSRWAGADLVPAKKRPKSVLTK